MITILQNWVHLIPPEEELVPTETESESIPEEYLATPYEILLTMSPPLRVITTRLEGLNMKNASEKDRMKEKDIPIER